MFYIRYDERFEFGIGAIPALMVGIAFPRPQVITVNILCIGLCLSWGDAVGN